ncbi:cytochrome ubiquinol oxidase subunit I [Variovorax saccharolyticus]|uniref:cytochrome ubiquinol oxidase subunit I n=1 Tax=Variovorax saccharolyticus TaxID=3053516 RepID=UPI002577E82E|nr:cytochrome ubiquinol oxidase subunit I [Variovorax sp. J22R187]MDM0022804.1 cytochrome ubiquinol oxidase subunit I [Variovorax sp. J22R187]
MNELLSGVDALLLSRIQFGFTITFHILFPSFSIGLAGFLVALEVLWLRTGDPRYWRLLRFWTTIFALSFGMGVVSGLVLAYQFGTNWSGMMASAGQVIGPLLSYETMTAFFLEASFLGVLLFGWRRVSPGMHFLSTCMVALGTCISAFWIMASNSWMQTPAGYALREGVFYPTDWWAIIFNPSFPMRYAHMLIAALLATAFAVAGVAAWYLINGRFVSLAQPMLKLALLIIVPLAPLQTVVGDRVGLNVGKYQPAKLAAIEGQWETSIMPLRLFALPNQDDERNHLEVSIPRLGSLIDEHSLSTPVRGLKEFAPADRPPVAIVFWSFRVMVGIGLLMLAVVPISLLLLWRRRLYDRLFFLRFLVCMSPAGFIAILAGWYTAEIGRQPYVVYGLLRTEHVLSPISVESVGISLAMFVIVYFAVFGAGLWYLFKAFRVGPIEIALPDQPRLGLRPLAAFADAEPRGHLKEAK